MNVSCFDEYLSLEKTFLVSCFNVRNYNDKIGYYRSNDFRNVLEYYVNTYLIRTISKSRERQLPLVPDVEKLYKMSLVLGATG